MSKIQELRKQLEQRKGKRNQLLKFVEEHETRIIQTKRELRNTEDAQLIIQTVAKQTQEKLEYHISNLVTFALEAIFDDPYTFNLEFISKRGKTEAELSFIKDNEKINPIMASGGGAVDVASFALRIALWNIQSPKSRNTIVLDEPTKFVSKDLLSKVSKMIKILSKKLNLQFIIVTHSKDLIEEADKVFKVSISKGKSNIEVM